MDRDAWLRFLSEWASAAVRKLEMAPEPGALSGLGFPGASETQLAAAEERLGCTLPPSYKSFLRCSNGLRQPGFIAARGGDFWPVEEIDWFRVRNQPWIDAYVVHAHEVPDSQYFVYGDQQDSVQFRAEYLRACLEISHDGDAAIYLLNPLVVRPDGEWEAWSFANWNPGAVRYRSFEELMCAHYEAFLSGMDGF